MKTIFSLQAVQKLTEGWIWPVSLSLPPTLGALSAHMTSHYLDTGDPQEDSVVPETSGVTRWKENHPGELLKTVAQVGMSLSM